MPVAPQTPAARPPAPDEADFVAGVEVGLSRVAGVVLDVDDQVVAQAAVDVPPDGDVVGATAALLRLLEATVRVDRLVLAVSTPGDRLTDGRRIVQGLGALDGRQVLVVDGGQAAAWAEHHARVVAEPLLLHVRVDDEIDGGIVSEGVLLRGGHGLTGRVGHLRLGAGRRVCGCGRRGCWQQYAGGSGVRATVRRHPDVLAPAGVLDPLGDARAVLALSDLDPVAQAAAHEIAVHLAAGLTALVEVLDPSLVVLGGSLATDRRLVGSVRDALAELPRWETEQPNLEVSQLGPDAAALGAALLTRTSASVRVLQEVSR